MKKFTFAFVFAALAFTAPTRAETVNCTAITALPAVISVQGIHCFTEDLTTAITTGFAIDIQTNNVVLDLNGFKLGGLAAGLGTDAKGIHAFDRQNITIKNGTIRGFLQGIILEDTGLSQGHVVEDIRADQNTFVGIQVAGAGNIVRNNQAVTTGGTTLGGGNNAFGIFVSGAGPRVLNNDVINTVAAHGFAASGISFSSATGGLAVNNRIMVMDIGIAYLGGSTGKYRDNLLFGRTTLCFSTCADFLGGTDAGNNN
jgi:hypothetical protein